jgi:hypothetical protein
VIEGLVVGFLVLVAVAIAGLFAAALSLFLWLVFLPFKILGLLFKGLGFLLALPFMLVFGVLGFAIFGLGAVFFLVPFLPFALIAWLAWRWVRGRPRAAVSA